MSNDPVIRSLSQAERQRARLGADAVCSTCGTAEHLRAYADGAVRCYQCNQVRHGRRPWETHHVAGRENSRTFVVGLSANDHRTITEWQGVLGINRWPAAEGDPIILVAHVLAGIGLILVLVAAWLIQARATSDWPATAGRGPIEP